MSKRFNLVLFPDYEVFIDRQTGRKVENHTLDAADILMCLGITNDLDITYVEDEDEDYNEDEEC